MPGRHACRRPPEPVPEGGNAAQVWWGLRLQALPPRGTSRPVYCVSTSNGCESWPPPGAIPPSALPPQTTLQLCSQAASPWAVFATSLEESILGRKPLWFVSFDRLGAYGRISSHTNMVRVGLGLGLGCIHQKSTLLAHVGACYQDQLGGLGVRAHGPDRQRGQRVLEQHFRNSHRP